MQSKTLTIALTLLHLVGVAAWLGARMWTFDKFHLFPILGVRFLLAVAIAVAAIRGSAFWRWFIVAMSSALAYSAFRQYFYLSSKGIVGDAFLLPGVVLTLCPTLMLGVLLAGILQQRRLAR